ncbi:serine hydrolase domain-containing protein [Natronoglomus mannanivorans]|uniref:Beta-lactamase family protein n=1 Tax=Natronoglomus mannanivorans TaxID=2979990 RepID=A0AAP2Z3U0_9EURY|nr:beta-lactamase family protein [Halobacteria archaeon AArc-xg1-1]
MDSDAQQCLDTARRRFLVLAGVGTASALAGCSGFDSGEATDESLPDHLDERVPDLLDRYDVPGASVALIENGAVRWSGAYGTADPATGRSTTDDTVYLVQSITKSVTAWGIMKLVERGEIALDDPIEDHVTSWERPDAEYPWSAVTVRRLLSHSAGLPAGAYEAVPPDEEPPSLREALSGETGGPVARPTDEPGTFRYSNPSYALLELLIEDVTGRDFAAYIDEEILTPLEMRDATFDRNDRVRSQLATEHLVDGTPVSEYHGPARAHGGLYATVEDVARFVAAGTEGTGGEPAGRGVLSPERVDELYTPVIETTGFYDLATDGSGLGHFAETLSNGERAVINGGQGTGSWNWFHAVPEAGIGLVVLTNSERSVQLITDVVGMWADQSGLPSVALTRATRWVRAPVWILGLVAAGLALRLGYGVFAGKRSFHPFSERDRVPRVVLAGLVAAVLGLWWGVGRGTVGYFLPVIAEWLGLALLAVVVLALLTTLFPLTGDTERHE